MITYEQSKFKFTQMFYHSRTPSPEAFHRKLYKKTPQLPQPPLKKQQLRQKQQQQQQLATIFRMRASQHANENSSVFTLWCRFKLIRTKTSF